MVTKNFYLMVMAANERELNELIEEVAAALLPLQSTFGRPSGIQSRVELTEILSNDP